MVKTQLHSYTKIIFLWKHNDFLLKQSELYFSVFLLRLRHFITKSQRKTRLVQVWVQNDITVQRYLNETHWHITDQFAIKTKIQVKLYMSSTQKYLNAKKEKQENYRLSPTLHTAAGGISCKSKLRLFRRIWKFLASYMRRHSVMKTQHLAIHPYIHLYIYIYIHIYGKQFISIVNQ